MDIFENRDLFLRFCLVFTRKWCLNFTQSEDFHGFRLRLAGQNMKVFKEDDVIHHIHVILALRMLCVGCYCFAIVLAFPFLFLFVYSKTERKAPF